MGTITSAQVAIPHSPQAQTRERIKVYEELEGGKGREIFFRPQRYTPDHFAPLEVWAEVTVDDVQYRGELRDISQGGLGLIWPRPVAPHLDDLIEEIVVCFDHQFAYVGSAVVSVVREEEEGTLVGLDLRDSLIKIDALLQTRDLKMFHRKGQAPFGGHSQPWQSEGRHEFKSRVADINGGAGGSWELGALGTWIVLRAHLFLSLTPRPKRQIYIFGVGASLWISDDLSA